MICGVIRRVSEGFGCEQDLETAVKSDVSATGKVNFSGEVHSTPSKTGLGLQLLGFLPGAGVSALCRFVSNEAVP